MNEHATPAGMTEEQLKRQMGQDAEFEAISEQNRKLVRENDKLKRELAKEDRLIEAMERNVGALPRVKKVPVPKPKMGDHAAGEATVIVTDPHAEEIVRAEAMEGLAEYGWGIFLNRCWMLSEKTVELVNIERLAAEISRLHVWFLGDNATGEIHEHDIIGNEFGMPETVPNVAFVFGQLLMGLAAHFDEVVAVGVCGNHTRSTKKVAFKRSAERNWDRAIYRTAKMLTMKEPSIKWVIPASMQTVVPVMGWYNYLTHGAEIPMTSRTPYYPIESTLQREAGMRHKVKRRMKDKELNVEFDYAWMGRQHHRAMLSDDIFICPSMIGANEYSKTKIHQMSLPQQNLVVFTEAHGVTTERPIKLHQADGHSFVDPREAI